MGVLYIGGILMINYVCHACGVQYEASNTPPEFCKVCCDERQFVPDSGQKWFDINELNEKGHVNEFGLVEPGVYSIKTMPEVGIGQKAYFITTPEGNFLWDCITFLDDQTIKKINDLGGIKAIAMSHPHYYSSVTDWAEAFDCPIYIHEADNNWVMKNSSRYVFWKGDCLELTETITLVHLGGHFEGSSVIHWSQGSSKTGTLFVGDSIYMVPDQGWVSFMYSYPNKIPLPVEDVKNIKKQIENYEFTSIFGAFDKCIKENGKEAILNSANRYIYHLERKSNS